MNAKNKIIERIVRVDQAGEVGAQRIYNGQKIVFKLLNNQKEYDAFSEMAQEEQEHLDYFDDLAHKRNIKPTKLAPVFDIGASLLGIGTALMGPKAAYACTEAVEEIIEEHYEKQILQLEGVDKEIQSKIKKFQADEANHKNKGIDNGNNSYPLLKKVINKTTEIAIFLAERT